MLRRKVDLLKRGTGGSWCPDIPGSEAIPVIIHLWSKLHRTIGSLMNLVTHNT
jgi:hypothetical protein